MAPYVWLFRGAVGQDFHFMDDNIRLHRAGLIDDILEGENIVCMDCSARSPNLNITEHVWDSLGKQVAATTNHQPLSKNCEMPYRMNGQYCHKMRLLTFCVACNVGVGPTLLPEVATQHIELK